MQTNIAQMTGSPILGGAIAGREILSLLLGLAQHNPPKPAAWYWDFHAVEVVSASFVRQGLVPAHAALRAQRSHLIPIITHANADVCEDLHLGFAAAHDAILTATIDATGAPARLTLIGDVDPHLQATFELVADRGETDARELKAFADSQPGSTPIVQTGWNNRLAKLVELGALVEVPHGRAKRYRLIV